MASTSITIRIDENLKKQAEMVFEDMGMNMTTAFTVFAKAVVRQGKIPFEITANVPNPETIAAMLEADKMLKDPDTKQYNSFTEILNEAEADYVSD